MTTHLSSFRIVILFITIILIGIGLFPSIKIEKTPALKDDDFVVSFSLPNSSPFVVEKQVTSVLENAFSSLSGIKNIRSVSYQNGGTVSFHFDKHMDLNFKDLEISSLIRRIYPELPDGVSYPLCISPIRNLSEQPLLVFSVHSEQSLQLIQKTIEESIEDKIAEIRGIQKFEISSGENLEIQIELDYDKCKQFRIEPSDVGKILNDLSRVSFPGVIRKSNGNVFFIKVVGGLKSVHELRNAQITTKNVNLKLDQLCNISIKVSEPKMYFRINGENALSISFFAREGSDLIKLSDTIKLWIKKIQADLHNEYRFDLEFDNSAILKQEQKQSESQILLSLGITFLVTVLAFRRLLSGIVLLVSVIASISLAFIFSSIVNIHFHLYSLAGAILVIGIIIDNTVIALDYYERFQNRQFIKSLIVASLIALCSLGLIFIFFEDQQYVLVDFILTIIVGIIASVVVCIFITPSIYELSSDNSKQTGKKQSFLRLSGLKYSYTKLIFRLVLGKKWLIGILIFCFGIPFFLLPHKIESKSWAGKLYNITFGSVFYQEKIRPNLDVYLGGTLRIFAQKVYSYSGFRNTDQTILWVRAKMPQGESIHQLNKILKEFESSLEGVKGIDNYETRISNGEFGTIKITFAKQIEPDFPQSIKTMLISQAILRGGIQWNIYGVGEGFNNKPASELPSYSILLKGYDYNELEKWAYRTEEFLKKYERVENINVDSRLDYNEAVSREFFLELDRYAFSVNNITQNELMGYVQQRSLHSFPVGEILVDSIMIPYVISNSKSEQLNSYDLLNEALLMDSLKIIRLGELNSNLSLKETLASIVREDRQYIRLVSFEYIGNPIYGKECLSEVTHKLKALMPLGYLANEFNYDIPTGERNKNIFLLIALFLTIIFAFTGILFESFKNALLTTCTICFSYTGIFSAFGFFDLYIDQGALAAFVMSGTIITGMCIYIINDWIQLKRIDRRDSYLLLFEALANRSRTIVITSFATCFALIPLIFANEKTFWFSFAIGTFSALAFAFPVVFIILPVLLIKRKEISKL